MEHRRRSGPTKRRLAGALIRRLRDRFAPGGCCTSARASGIRASSCRAGRCGCYWREDGEPIWRDPALIADETKPTGATPRRRAALRARAGRARCSSIAGYVMPGLRGRLLLPVARAAAAGQRRSVRRRKLRRPDGARAAARACSSRGSTAPVGYVLPLARDAHDEPMAAAGAAGRGSCARETLFLIPGDSPIGYRLPLDSLPWAAPADDAQFVTEPDPMVARIPPAAARRLPPRAGAAPQERAAGRRRPTATARRAARPGGARWRPTGRQAGHRYVGQPASCAPRCASSRATASSRLHAAARARSRTTSSWSPRSRTPPRELGHAGRASRATRRRAIRACNRFSVTPDPGVIEVNIHPAHELGRAGRQHRDRSTRRRAQTRLGDREVHARRPPHRHRRRQPRRARRRRRRPTARSCAGPTCCAACSATGTTIRRCRTCSRACSSARPARLRASTRRATTRSTSWRSPSAQIAGRGERRRRRGWSTASSATC